MQEPKKAAQRAKPKWGKKRLQRTRNFWKERKWNSRPSPRGFWSRKKMGSEKRFGCAWIILGKPKKGKKDKNVSPFRDILAKWCAGVRGVMWVLFG